MARADSWSRGGGAVEGDASGDVSDSDDELPEIVSRFLLPGEGIPLAGRSGEAICLSALRSLRRDCLLVLLALLYLVLLNWTEFKSLGNTCSK